MITVGQPILPDRHKLDAYLDRVYRNAWLTNHGPLVQELEARLAAFLGLKHVLLVANGTLALQVALRTLGITGRVVTTPFSFAATAAAIRNEGLGLRFADIDPATLNLNPQQAERACDGATEACLPVHVYGTPCDVAGFDALAQRRGLKTVYDAAHTLGVIHRGHSPMAWGDAAALSLHATKLFHTGEGGVVAFRDADHLERARRLINFGLDPARGDVTAVGLNAKMSELQAAVGLALIDDLADILTRRRHVVASYQAALAGVVGFPAEAPETQGNGAYAPVLLSDEATRDAVQATLAADGIRAKPYFAPALDATAAYGTGQPLPNAADAARRILCLPVAPDFDQATIGRVVAAVKRGLAG